MFTLEQLARVMGDGRYGDQLEQVAFNLLPAANDPRMLAHQYHQQANQVLVSFATRDWSFSGPDANVFGLVRISAAAPPTCIRAGPSSSAHCGCRIRTTMR